MVEVLAILPSLTWAGVVLALALAAARRVDAWLERSVAVDALARALSEERANAARALEAERLASAASKSVVDLEDRITRLELGRDLTQ